MGPTSERPRKTITTASTDTDRPLAALQGLDEEGRVIYIGTMSKVMFPGHAFTVVPDDLVDAFRSIHILIDSHPLQSPKPPSLNLSRMDF